MFHVKGKLRNEYAFDFHGPNLWFYIFSSSKMKLKARLLYNVSQNLGESQVGSAQHPDLSV